MTQSKDGVFNGQPSPGSRVSWDRPAPVTLANAGRPGSMQWRWLKARMRVRRVMRSQGAPRLGGPAKFECVLPAAHPRTYSDI